MTTARLVVRMDDVADMTFRHRVIEHVAAMEDALGITVRVNFRATAQQEREDRYLLLVKALLDGWTAYIDRDDQSAMEAATPETYGVAPADSRLFGPTTGPWPNPDADGRRYEGPGEGAGLARVEVDSLGHLRVFDVDGARVFPYPAAEDDL